jgi:energy-coupling factor transport system permease protein
MMQFRYTEKTSSIHLLNPLSKLAWAISLTVLTLLLDHPLALLLLFLVTLPPVFFAGIRREWISFMKYSLWLCLTVIVLNVLFSYQGSHVLYSLSWRIPVVGVPQITLEALVFGMSMSLRLLTVISAFTLITLTVHPDDILQALLKIKIPYKSVLVTSLSARFVPALIEDANRISDLQRSRGLETERGNWFRRIRNRAAVLMPLLTNSLDRTVQIAEAMEARGFGSGNGRSFFRSLKITRMDTLALGSALLPLLPTIVLRLRGEGVYQYYPALGGVSLSHFAWSMLAIIVCLFGLMGPLGICQMRRRIDKF